MPYRFTTPSIKEGMQTNDPLFRYYSLDKGITVVYDNDEFYETRYPSEDELVNVSAYWLGGHVYVVDDSMAARLIDAGYGEFLTEITNG